MTIGSIENLIIHFIGNKNNGEGVHFSDKTTEFGNIEVYIKQLFDNGFKSEELFQFYFQPKLELNPMYQFISSIFNDKESFIEESQNAGRYLYDKSTHPQIKGGELCVVYFSNCQLNNKTVDCIGLFKSENKQTILKVNTTENGLNLKEEQGINVNKIDKGCLIYNTGKEEGYLISEVDNTNRSSEAQYWKNDFLGIQPIKSEFHQTNDFLGITKQFVTQHLPLDFEVSKADQIDFLNRSVNYFKNHEKFDKSDFEDKVFEDDDVIESFQKYDRLYRQDNEVEVSDNFEISKQAVKKQARVFKSVLKLDKNFHIYIHGGRELIEQGFEKDGRKFYKIYYTDEN